MKKQLFISHSTKDDAAIDDIAEKLEAADFQVWVDHREGIEPGTPSWDRAIREAIMLSDAGLFVMSPPSLESEICGGNVCWSVNWVGRSTF